MFFVHRSAKPSKLIYFRVCCIANQPINTNSIWRVGCSALQHMKIRSRNKNYIFFCRTYIKDNPYLGDSIIAQGKSMHFLRSGLKFTNYISMPCDHDQICRLVSKDSLQIYIHKNTQTRTRAHIHSYKPFLSQHHKYANACAEKCQSIWPTATSAITAHIDASVDTNARVKRRYTAVPRQRWLCACRR